MPERTLEHQWRPQVDEWRLVARTSDLFLSANAHLRDHEAYIDLSALFREATNLDAQGYGLALLLFLGSLYEISGDNVGARSAVVAKSVLTGPALGFTDTQADDFFSLAGREMTTFVRQVREQYGGRIRPQYQLPLEQSPLVRLADQAVCLSVSLLERRMTSGLYHVLLNARAGPENVAFRNRYMRFIGHVFAEHVEHAFDRIASYELARNRGVTRRGLPSRRIIGNTAITAVAEALDRTPSLCDTVLVSGEDLILIESKARMLSLNARAGGKPEEFFSRFEEIFVDGARQLHSTIEFVLAGGLQNNGVDPRRIRRIFPVVVSLQDFTWNPPLRSWLDDLLASHRLLRPRQDGRIRIAAVEPLDIDDVERLELSVEHGKQSAAELLASKQSDRFWRSHSFATWSVVTRTPHLESTARSSYHSRRYDEVAGAALELVRIRTRRQVEH